MIDAMKVADDCDCLRLIVLLLMHPHRFWQDQVAKLAAEKDGDQASKSEASKHSSSQSVRRRPPKKFETMRP